MAAYGAARENASVFGHPAGGITPRRRRSRPRIALLWGLGCFAALQLGLTVAIEASWLPEARDPEYGLKLLGLRRRRATGGQPTVIMLGSSRTAWGFQARSLDHFLSQELGAPATTYNFGILAAGPVTELLMLKRLLAQGIRPKLMVVEVLSPVLVDWNSCPAEVTWMAGTRLWPADLEVLRRLHSPTLSFWGLWLQNALHPSYTYRVPLVCEVAPEWLTWQARAGHLYHLISGMDEGGWAPMAKYWETRSPQQYQQGLKDVKKWASGFFTNFRLGPQACQALRETLNLCRRHGIATALVLMPEASGLREFYPPAAWQEIRALVGQVSREYRSPLIDAREWIADEDFADGQHLRRRGAFRFTRRLAYELAPILGGPTRGGAAPAESAAGKRPGHAPR